MFETSLQDFVGRYLDALAVGDDPIAARGIGLIIDRFAISVRRAARGLHGIQSLSPDFLPMVSRIAPLMDISQMVSLLVLRANTCNHL
jgi:hypothetical protein